MIKKIIPEKTIGFITKSVSSELTKKDSILYCLGKYFIIIRISKRYWI